MKKMKTALLGTTLVGALVVAGGFGTYSWFTSETSASGEIANGTLQINNGQNITEKVIDGVDFAPSQLKYGEWMTIDNSGSQDTHIKATLSQSLDKDINIKKYKVGYIALKYKEKPSEDVMKASKIKLEKLFNGTTNVVDTFQSEGDEVEVAPGVTAVMGVVGEDGVAELKAVSDKEWLLGEGTNKPFWRLKSDHYIDVVFAIKLDESANNDYQGVKYTADLKVQAKQADEGSKYDGE
jgi:spore coat-associated protein N